MFLAFSIADIIQVPFGYLLDWLYQFSGSYGFALIVFSIVVQLVLLPMTANRRINSGTGGDHTNHNRFISTANATCLQLINQTCVRLKGFRHHH